MATIKGFYINLDKEKERDRIIRENLSEKGKLHLYSRFRAIEGSEEEASLKSLKKGEDGIWKSWIKLLDNIDRGSDFDYIHIIEDDAILSDEFFGFVNKLGREEPKTDIIMTDMYVNIDIYKAFQKLADEFSSLQALEKIWLTDEYTGCIASCLIHKNKVHKIRKILQDGYQESKLIPIDNYLRRMNKRGELNICTTLPFLTSVQLSSISESTIQDRDIDMSPERMIITRTQIYNTYLRRMLSVFRKKTEIMNGIELARKIISTRHELIEKYNAEMIETTNNFLDREELLMYRREKRLDKDDNPQAGSKPKNY